MPSQRFVPLALAAVLAASSAFVSPAAAQEETPTLESCGRDYDRCASLCAARNPDSAAAEAGCAARCAAERAACEARAGYAEAKPWVREQMEKLRDFLEGFREGPEAPPAPSPPPETENDEPPLVKEI